GEGGAVGVLGDRVLRVGRDPAVVGQVDDDGVAIECGREARGPRSWTLRRAVGGEAALAVAADAVRGALAAEILADLADVVVDPPDVRVVVALRPEVRLAERQDRRRAGRAAAHRTQIEQTSQTGSEEVALCHLPRPHPRVRDAWRVPDEEPRVV